MARLLLLSTAISLILSSCYTVNNSVDSTWRSVPEQSSTDSSYQLLSTHWEDVEIVSTPQLNMAMWGCESTTRYEAYCLQVTNITDGEVLLSPYHFGICYSNANPVPWNTPSPAWDSGDVYDLQEAQRRSTNWNVSMVTLTVSSLLLIINEMSAPFIPIESADPDLDFYYDLVGDRIVAPGETAEFRLYFDESLASRYRMIGYSPIGDGHLSTYNFTFERVAN